MSFSKTPGVTSTVTKGNEAERLVRCRVCGFPCDLERDVNLKDGSWAGFGITQGAQQTASSTGILGVPSILNKCVDGFDGNWIDRDKWTISEAGSILISQSNSKLIFTFPASSTSSTRGIVTTKNTYNFTGQDCFIKVTTVPIANSVINSELAIIIDSDNYFSFIYRDSLLRMFRNIAGSGTTVGTFTYNSTTHLYWRIKEAGGIIYWETSSGNNTWIQRGSYSHSLTITSVTSELSAYANGNVSSAGTFEIDKFNFTQTESKHGDYYYNRDVTAGCPNCGSYVYNPRQRITKIP